MTNEEVWQLLTDAITHLEHVHPGLGAPSRVAFLRDTLSEGRAYAASGNNIPVLRGQGLEELTALARRALAGEFDPGTRVPYRFKHAALTFGGTR